MLSDRVGNRTMLVRGDQAADPAAVGAVVGHHLDDLPGDVAVIRAHRSDSGDA